MTKEEIEAKVDEQLEKSKLWKLYGKSMEHEKIDPIKQATNKKILKNAIYYAVGYIEKIKKVLEKFTAHGMQHSFNVLQIMGSLLENIKVGENGRYKEVHVSSYETGILILSAFFHDIGMSILEGQKVKEEYGYIEYQEKNMYIKKDLVERYIRDQHHERVKQFIEDYQKTESLELYRENGSTESKGSTGDDLKRVCISHNMGEEGFSGLVNTKNYDMKFCGVILRLADILDLDNSRAPIDRMNNIVFEETEEDQYSWDEWKKHIESGGVVFDNRNTLTLRGLVREPIIYRKLQGMVEAIKKELVLCDGILATASDFHKNIILPRDIHNDVHPNGFELGEYSYTLDKKDVENLFMKENLYMDKMVFIREMLQNAIDATIYYQKAKKKEFWQLNNIEIELDRIPIIPIEIYIWNDKEDKISFLIRDHGSGMNEEVIKNYFLKIGKSFYSSVLFKRTGVEFEAISRFGIGFLSTFMVTDKIIVVTKHYEDDSILWQLTLDKNGNDYIVCKNENIKGKITGWDGQDIILSRMYSEKNNRHGTMIYFQIKENALDTSREHFVHKLDQYLCMPPVPVHCNVFGQEMQYSNKQIGSFAKKIEERLEKDKVLRLSENSFRKDKDIIFESHPIIITHQDQDGKIYGNLNVMTIYDTGFRKNPYNFSYELDYEEDTILIKIGVYQKLIEQIELNPNYRNKGISDKIKIYFNGINHLEEIGETSGRASVAPGFFCGYFLLEGKYKPNVNVARSGSGYLDLHTLAYVNYLCWQQISEYVKGDSYKRNAYFSLKQPDILIDLQNTIYYDNDLRNQITNLESWNEVPIIQTKYGFYSVHEIQDLFVKKGMKEIELLENIMLNNVGNFRKLIICYLLQINFTIILRVNECHERVLLKNKKEGSSDDMGLPPLFMIEYENMDVLKYGNYPLNNSHWFSKWMVGLNKDQGTENCKMFLVQILQGEWINAPYRKSEFVDKMNKIIHKYSENVLNYRDFIIYGRNDEDVRKWLEAR